MFHEKIKSLFRLAVAKTVSSISKHSITPVKDFSRRRKLLPDSLITFLVAEGSSGTKNELLDFFGMAPERPSSSAFSQQRAKLKPEALESVFKEFHSSVESLEPADIYRFLTSDDPRLLIQVALLFPRKNILSPQTLPLKAATVYISILFLTLGIVLIHTLSSSPYTIKMNSRTFCTIVDSPHNPGCPKIYTGESRLLFL